MQLSVEMSNILPLFLVLLVLAAIPGVSVMTVCARTVSFGFTHGVLVTLGIVTGDIIFIFVAVFGLALLVETMGKYFVLIQLAGGLYLLWLGVDLLKTHAKSLQRFEPGQSSLLSSYLSGLMVTLPDQKAILFYLGLFPAFVDMSQLTVLDSMVMVLMAAIAIASSKLAYAYFANHMRIRFSTSTVFRFLYYIAGTLLLAVGLFLLLSALGSFIY